MQPQTEGAASLPRVGSRFPQRERRLLLAEPRIGPQVVERLEDAGFHSLDQLRRLGAAAAVHAVCIATGSGAWANRRRALERLLQRSASAA